MHSGRNLAGRTGSGDPVPVAASVQVAALLDGPLRHARVLGAFPQAAYLAVQGAPPGRDVLALLAPDAVRQPIGAVLPTAAAVRCLDLLRAPDVDVLVGRGRLDLGTTTLLPRRWWTARPSGHLREGWTPLSVPPLPAEVRAPAGHLCVALNSASGPAVLGQAVATLTGLGPGLTPAGDDLLCGALAGLHVASPLTAARLADVVRRLAPVRTTQLSAALLVAAADGACLPELAALLCAPSPDRAAAALRQLLAVGHTSGACLAAGALLALRAITVSDETSETTLSRSWQPALAPRGEEAVA